MYPRERRDGKRAGDVEIREGGEPGKFVREVKWDDLRSSSQCRGDGRRLGVKSKSPWPGWGGHG